MRPLAVRVLLAGTVLIIVATQLVAQSSPVVRTQLVTRSSPLPRHVPLAPFDSAVAERLLTLYDRGEYPTFDTVLVPLATLRTNWVQFEVAAERWIGDSKEPTRRRLVAASVALELASAQRASWGISRYLIEVGCAWLRQQDPTEAERQWQLAAIELVLSEGDHEFLIDRSIDPREGPKERQRWEIKRRQDLLRTREDAAKKSRFELKEPLAFSHLEHARERFRDEPVFRRAELRALERRVLAAEEFVLLLSPPRDGRMPQLSDPRKDPTWLEPAAAEALARSGPQLIEQLPAQTRMTPSSAALLLKEVPTLPAALLSIDLWALVQQLTRALEDQAFAPEARLRLGHTYLRLAQPEEAVRQFATAAATSRDDFIPYLAAMMGGQTLQQLNDPAATVAYRRAVQILPGAQSALLALAPLLFASRPDDAMALMQRAVTPPLAMDPLKHYFADPRVWPARVTALRQALR